jgi:hypothetical protein
MATSQAYHAWRVRLRRLFIATTSVFAASIVITYPASGSGNGHVTATPGSASDSTTLQVTVQPTQLTRRATAPPVFHDPIAATSLASNSSGKTSATSVMAVHVRVVPGTAQWLAEVDTASRGTDTTQILVGKVLYAIGDQHAWQLVAHVTGANGYRATPQCSGAYEPAPDTANNVIAGEPTIVGSAPVVICRGVQGHSGGVFSLSLTLDGRATGAITVTVELIP